MAITKIDSSMLEDVSGANNLVKLDANAKIPAGTASGLLIKPGPFTSASDPTKSSNKTLGTEWLNSASGEMYICTDATADANIWTNVGDGSGDVAPFHGAGSNYGYNLGGGPSPYTNRIEKYSFTSASNGVDVADTTVSTSMDQAGCSSTTHGYSAGGNSGGAVPGNIIDKHQFATTNNSTDVGDLTSSRAGPSGVSSETHGYACAGYNNFNTIDRWTFASDGNATDHGDVYGGTRYGNGSTSSETHGYVCGGYNQGKNICKFAYTSNVTASSVGNLTGSNSRRENTATNSTSTYGYVSGSNMTPTDNPIIDRHSFTSDGNAVDVGDLASPGHGFSGTSALDYGYISANAVSGSAPIGDMIQRFAYASSSNSVDTTANLTAANGYPAPAQY